MSVFCGYQAACALTALECVGKPSSVMSVAGFSLQTSVAICALYEFLYCFFFSSSVKNAIRILMGIALTL